MSCLLLYQTEIPVFQSAKSFPDLNSSLSSIDKTYFVFIYN